MVVRVQMDRGTQVDPVSEDDVVRDRGKGHGVR